MAKESGLEWACMNNDDFTVLVSGGSKCHWVNMCNVGCHIQNDWVEQWICIKFYIKFEHSSTETTQMIQKAAAMGNRWLAALSQQHTFSCIASCAEFFGETSNHPGHPDPHSPDLEPCDFWLFPKLKSPLKGKRFQAVNESRANIMGQLMVLGRTV